MRISFDSGSLKNDDPLAAIGQLEPSERTQLPTSVYWSAGTDEAGVVVFKALSMQHKAAIKVDVEGTSRTLVYGLAATLQEELEKKPSTGVPLPPVTAPPVPVPAPASATTSPVSTTSTPRPSLFNRVSYHPVGGPVLVTAIVGLGTWAFTQFPAVAAWLAAQNVAGGWLSVLLGVVFGVITALVPTIVNRLRD